MPLSEVQRAALLAPLDDRLVREHPYIRQERTGKPAKYLPIADVILRLNEIFGADGWSREILKIERVHGPIQVEKEARGKKYQSWQVTWMAHVTLTLRDGSAFAGASAWTAYANPPNPPNDRTAIEAAISAATKQAAKVLGPSFGLLLSDDEDPYGEGWAAHMEADAPPPAAAPRTERDAPPAADPPPANGRAADPPAPPPPPNAPPPAAGMTADDREGFVRLIADYHRTWRATRGGKPQALGPYKDLGGVRALGDDALVALGNAIEQECIAAGVHLPGPAPDAGGTP